jgi:hypothetical protein
MFSVYFCEPLQHDFYDLKHNLIHLDKYINKFNLKEKNYEKCYYKNNILIEAFDKKLYFYKIIDKNIFYKVNYLFIEYDKILIPQFNFFKVDYEEEYKVYEGHLNSIIIKCKVFNDYFELEFLSDDLKAIKEIIIL